MSGSTPIGVAVLGCGGISTAHLPAWRRLVVDDAARLVAVCDSELGRAEAAAARYGADRCSASFEDVVRWPDVQAVDICLPHHLHLPAILAAAAAGKHVLCEKPLVLDLGEAVQALRACRAAGVVLMTADRDRFEPHARAVKRIIADGLLGRVNMVLERHLLHKDVLTQASTNHTPWKLGRRTAGGGSLHRDGVYYLDSLRYWAGCEVAHVTGAELGNFLWETEEIETTAHVLFRFRSGAVGVFELSWCLQGPHRREVTINGTEGYLRLEGGVRGDATITVHSRRLAPRVFGDPAVVQAFQDCIGQRPEQAWPERAGEALVLHVPAGGGYFAEQKEFVAAIREGREPESSGVDGARALEVVEGAYRAAAERRAIAFPLVDWAEFTTG